MKIAKALKLKNRLAGEISRLKNIVKFHNSRNASVEGDYDVKQIVAQTLPQKIHELVMVKTAIACSNAGVKVDEDSAFWSIFMMAELKGMIEMLREVNTKHGSFNESHSYGVVNPQPTVYVAALDQKDVDKVVAYMEKQIDNLQDKLDTHNALWDCSELDGITI